MYIERLVKNWFWKISKVYPIVALVGPRQAGKTTFLKEQARQKKSNYLLFDDPDVRDLFETDIKKLEKQYLEGKEVTIFDEVQYCNGAGRTLKYLADNGKKLWITSSSEIVLCKDVLSFLVGRVTILRIYPFSLPEFFSAKNLVSGSDKMLQRGIWEHIRYGGYPQAVLVDDAEVKQKVLQDLYETMILKDVAMVFSIDDINSLNRMAKYLANSPGALLSYETISCNLGLPFRTVRKYLDAMEKSYLIVRVHPFFKNKNKELTKQPKVYFIDTGLCNAISRESEINGRIFENYVFSELVKMGYTLKFWRTKSKAEVDFIIEFGKEIVPMEVKLTCDKKVTRSMQSFIAEYKPKKAFVVYYQGKGGKVHINGCTVEFIDMVGLWKGLGKLQ